MSKSRSKKSYNDVLAFTNPKIPSEVEDEILTEFANYSIEHDMTVRNLDSFFGDLQMPKDLTKMVNRPSLCIEGTDFIDFDKLLKQTYHLLVYMDNLTVIDTQWEMLVHTSGRDTQFPSVSLRNHVLSIKDLQKVANSINMDSHHLVEMMSCATQGQRVYITWMDFAYLLGRLGQLTY
ncbi:LAFE_0F14708g1_1 [Lachancea fermentati]|uniref:LAFE_0F14708g1_1 n=1 Tax=Lachancea fermentati TaxID=4955 RepID=A0A1G4MGF0_LACFM|nr:LAFE_0F14708g1_1 [Lachancea fermentati]